MIVWRLGGKIIRTVVHSDMHTCEQFLNLLVGIGLDFFVCVCLGFNIYRIFVLAYIISFLCCLLFIRLKARILPNIVFSFCDVHTFGYNSTESKPI